MVHRSYIVIANDLLYAPYRYPISKVVGCMCNEATFNDDSADVIYDQRKICSGVIKKFDVTGASISRPSELHR